MGAASYYNAALDCSSPLQKSLFIHKFQHEKYQKTSSIPTATEGSGEKKRQNKVHVVIMPCTRTECVKVANEIRRLGFIHRPCTALTNTR